MQCQENMLVPSYSCDQGVLDNYLLYDGSAVLAYYSLLCVQDPLPVEYK